MYVCACLCVEDDAHGDGDGDDDGIQEMHVYEINEKDRGSPAYLPFSLQFDLSKPPLLPKGALGDLVPFTNKVSLTLVCAWFNLPSELT